MTSEAVLSEDGRYRYWLSRRWAPGSLATFVMLNPSTADAEADDPTIRRCIGFARSWGLAGIVVVNLYALRATDPKALWRVDAAQRVGPQNDEHLRAAAQVAYAHESPLIAAWGSNAKPGRVSWVCEMPHMDRLTALGITKDGAPRHPLYLRSDAAPSPWGAAA